MTIVLGVATFDGIYMASDGYTTQGDRIVSTDARKIRALGPWLCGSSGQEWLRDFLADLACASVESGRALARLMAQELAREPDFSFDEQEDGGFGLIDGELLFGRWVATEFGPRPRMWACYGLLAAAELPCEVVHGIGSGRECATAIAYTLVSECERRREPVDWPGVLVRSIRIACQLQTDLGGEISMAHIDREGEVRWTFEKSE